MSTETEKLKLFKWDTSNEIDLESDFDIEKTLNDGNYKNSKAKVNVKIKDDELYIKSVEIYILNEYDKSEVKKYIFDKLGINAQVYYIGE